MPASWLLYAPVVRYHTLLVSRASSQRTHLSVVTTHLDTLPQISGAATTITFVPLMMKCR